jgi:hypothetical protein
MEKRLLLEWRQRLNPNKRQSTWLLSAGTVFGDKTHDDSFFEVKFLNEGW